MTNAEVAEKYHSMSVKLADFIAEIKEMCEYCKYLNEQTQDAGDTQMDLEEVIRTAGVALAAIVTYAHEYGTDFADHEGKDE